jgi:putative transposase
LKANGIEISMDGKGRWMDNVFIERLWRSVKYEHIYLHSYDSIADLRVGLKTYFGFFNQERTHQGLARQTPDEVYFPDRLRKAA